MATKKLTKSQNKSLAGVCAGLAEYFDFDVTLVRVIYCVLTLFTSGFPGVLLYVILALVMPEKDNNSDIEEAEVVK